MDIYQIISISAYLMLMIGIGWYSYRKSTSNVDEFLLGGRKMGPAVTALSAGASDMSGWLLMGLPGAMFVSGLSASWIAIGLTTGAYLNYVLIAPKFRIYTEKAGNALTIPDYFENRFHDHKHFLRLISGLVILVFFTLYTSAGMVAGGKLFESAFNTDYSMGLWITSSVVILYTFLGGFLAVSLTDFVQGTIMMIAIIVVPIVVFFELGGVSETFNTIKQIDPTHFSMFRGTTWVSIVSLLAWGLGYCGQPHILARFMAIDTVKQIRTAKKIGISWMVITVCGALSVGLVGIAYLNKTGQSISDPETIFIFFSQELFHPLIGGFLLSAILAAVMSTISSQLLVSSSSVTEDFYKSFFRREASGKELLLVSRLSVLLVAIVALALSLNPEDTILELVGHAWAGFGSAFGPVILFSLLWKGTTRNGAIAGMVLGGLVVLLWTYWEHPFSDMYSMIPGFALSSLAIFIVSKIDKRPSKAIEKEFEEVQQVYRDDY